MMCAERVIEEENVVGLEWILYAKHQMPLKSHHNPLHRHILLLQALWYLANLRTGAVPCRLGGSDAEVEKKRLHSSPCPAGQPMTCKASGGIRR